MSLFDRVRSVRTHFAALVAAVAMAITSMAAAQFGEAAGIAEAMQPDYYKRDIVVISQGLQLDETQRIIVNTLYEDYIASFEQGVENMKKRFEDMRADLQTDDQRRIITLVFAPFRDWSAEKANLGHQFLANIEVVLTQEQRDVWPSVQRRLYRERHLTRGRLSGENLDLFNVVRDMHFDQRISVQIQPVLEAYEIALDRALHARDDQLIGKDNPMLTALELDDSEMRRKAMHDFIDKQVAVRNVNDEYIEAIADALPQDLAEKFRLAALDRAYPRVYRETPVQRIFKVALELEGLDSATRDAIAHLEAEFLTALNAVNAEILDAIRKTEPIEARERADDFGRRMAGMQVEPKTDPTRPLFVKREELFREYVKRLKGLVTNEQFDLLPGGYRWLDPVPTDQAPQERKRFTPSPKGRDVRSMESDAADVPVGVTPEN